MKGDSVQFAAAFPKIDRFEDNPPTDEIKINKERASDLISCMSNTNNYDSPNQIPVADEEEDSNSMSSEDNDCQFSVQAYLCCEDDPCKKEVVILDQCPNQFKNYHLTIECDDISHLTLISTNKSQNDCINNVRKADETISTSSVDSIHDFNCQTYTCCENESCDEAIVILDQCPNEEVRCKYTNTKSPTSNEEEGHYRKKDLSDFLGIKDGVSPSLSNCIKALEDIARKRSDGKFKKLAQEIIKENSVDE